MEVVKRNGERQILDITKIQRQVEWACEGLKVSQSDIELASQLKFYDGIQTKDIHDTLVKSAADLITVWEPDYSRVAGRLNNHQFRKEAYNDINPPALLDHVQNVIALGMYDPSILEAYTPEEFGLMDSFIDHSRDFDLEYVATEQFKSKYLVRDRSNPERGVVETPQMLYIMVAATLAINEPKATRMQFVHDAYEAISQHYISLPTPIMAGVRTPTRQFSSCVLIECDDSLDSIGAVASTIMQYVSKRAGIGIQGGAIRAIGSKIGNGEVLHTGLVPFWKLFQTAVHSCSQGGVRGGAATVFYPMWHMEYEDLIVLKNNRGTEENRIRRLDYAVQTCGLFARRYVEKGNITLFSPDVAGGQLYKLFYEDMEKFEKLYVELENDPTVPKKVVSASDVWTKLVLERSDTGRIYLHWVDVTIKGTPFDPETAPVRMSNLCLEILQPTKAQTSVDDPNAEVALCTLAALNWGKMELVDVKKYMTLAVRLLDNLLSYQDYIVPAAKRFTDQFRALGIGAIGYAHFLAKKDFRYGQGLKETRELAEHMQYYGLLESTRLASERGRCEGFDRLKYAKGWLKADDTPAEEKTLDWEYLRGEIQAHGLRNSTVMAFMPSETSSQISNETSGLEPPHGLVSSKKSKTGVLTQVVPEVETLFNSYTTCWEVADDNRNYLNALGEIMKFNCQAISANTWYVPARHKNNKVPAKILIRDILHARKVGLPTLYYQNTNDEADLESQTGCESGACSI